jgi:hypothetical protein
VKRVGSEEIHFHKISNMLFVNTVVLFLHFDETD